MATTISDAARRDLRRVFGDLEDRFTLYRPDSEASAVARRDLTVGIRLELLKAEHVVAVGQPALVHIQRPAAVLAALRYEGARSATLRNDDLGGHGVRLVLDVEKPDHQRRQKNCGVGGYF